MGGTSPPFRIRFRVPLTLIPLVSGIVAFGVQALFGTPGMRDEEAGDAVAVPEPD